MCVVPVLIWLHKRKASTKDTGRDKLPLKSLMSAKLLAFVVCCSIGPKTSVGHRVTTSSPVFLAYSQALVSATVLEKQYQCCTHNIRRSN